jgi:hypothetical protein
VRQEAERSISTNCGIDTLLNLTAKVLPVGGKSDRAIASEVQREDRSRRHEADADDEEWIAA